MGAHTGRIMLTAGAQAPEFRLRSTRGEEESLTGLVAQGPILLTFYKASCPVCQLTLPFLERLKDSGIRVVYISQDDKRSTEEFLRAFRLTAPALLDESGSGYPVSKGYGISAVPSLFQVEPDGQISYAWSGWSKAEMMALGERAGVQMVGDSDQVPVLRPG